MCTPTNPNNCDTCDHMPDPGKVGYCYMWKTAPDGVCGYHTGIRKAQREAALALAQVIRMTRPEARQ